MAHEDRPVLALTPGDPGGVGPEIVAAALADSALAREVRLVLVDRAGDGPHPPRPTARGGQASLEAFEEAIRLACEGAVDGIVTGPVDKRSLALAGSPFPGHTALLRERTGNPRLRMMMAAPLETTRWSACATPDLE
ncbi:MAG: 4-hydroxythreonine-4-phosphate dehydrogenase PdxA, partial [Planctomycetes bacterium]|nr:4-hydroxythreonine-4-phosphate dehydrogenase PdxA [Planctomycetota bacterium]